MRFSLLFLTISLITTVFTIHEIHADDNYLIPHWVKTNAEWWAEDQIDDKTFSTSIEFLINDGIILVPNVPSDNIIQEPLIPNWVKNNAGWWADGQIPDSAFIDGIQYLIKDGIIKIN